jgi:hypothetical protein
MLRRARGQPHAGVLARLPPVELLHPLGRHAHLDQPRLDAERNEVALHRCARYSIVGTSRWS